MSENTDDRVTTNPSSDVTTGSSKEWATPTLTVLGDANAMTAAGGSKGPDGPTDFGS